MGRLDLQTIALSAYSLLDRNAMDGKPEDFKHELKRITRRIYHTNLARTKMTETENQENRKAFTFVPNINERSKEMMN